MGRISGLDWSDRASHADTYVDPYLVWADITGAAGFAALEPGDSGSDTKWPLIVEFSKAGLSPMDCCHIPDGPWVLGLMDIPGLYKPYHEEGEPETIGSKYVTAHVNPMDIGHLFACKDIIRFQLGLPRIPRVSTTPFLQPPRTRKGQLPRVVIGVIDDGFGFAHARLSDHLGNPRVRYLWDQDPARESEPSDSPWKFANDVGYGRELRHTDLDALVARSGGNDLLAPYSASRYGHFRLDPETHSSSPQDPDGRALPIASMLPASHGQAVLDLVAGFPPEPRDRVSPPFGSSARGPRELSVVKDEFKRALGRLGRVDHHDGIALTATFDALDTSDQWHSVLVQLPTRTIADTSGGSLAVHILDGVYYILNRAARLPLAEEGTGDTSDGHRDEASREENPVVILLGYGALAGGHDGTSLLEEAFEEIRAKRRKYSLPAWIVLAAGNPQDGQHTSVDIRPGETAELTWIVGPDNPLESYLEIWIPEADWLGAKLTTRADQFIHIEARSPNGRPSLRIHAGDIARFGAGDSEHDEPPIAAVIYPRKVAQSRIGTMILVALAPTRIAGARTPAPHGEWWISLTWGHQGQAADHPVATVHVWSERSDLLFGLPRRQQNSVYSDEPVGVASEFDPEALSAWRRSQHNPVEYRSARGVRPGYGLSSLAGGAVLHEELFWPHVLVVGSHRASDREASRISASGPSRTTTAREEWELLHRRGAPSGGESDGNVVEKRARPDISATGDTSVAVAGIRAQTLHEGRLNRISATSAASAVAARYIGYIAFLITLIAQTRDQAVADLLPPLVEFLFDEADGAAAMPDAQRATLTPRSDDAFRRGQIRVRSPF